MAGKEILQWYFPEDIAKPKCIEQLLKFTYPAVDWDRVTYHQGLPHVMNWFAGDKGAVTLPSPFSFKGIDTYFNDGKWDPCDCGGLALIVHEGFHALQIKNLAGGFGLGIISLNTIRYLTCSLRHIFNNPYCDNDLEIEAYAFAGSSITDCHFPESVFDSHCDPKLIPCDCGCMPPSVDQARWQQYQQRCASVVRKSSKVSFSNYWGSLADCIPGLNKIADLAKYIFRLGCKSRISPYLLWLPCVLSLLGSGVIWAIYGLYYAVWFAIMLVVVVILELAAAILAAGTIIIGGIIWLGEQIGSAISGLFSSPSGYIFYTVFDGYRWNIPDSRVGHGKSVATNASPSLAVFNGKLYMAYRDGGDSRIWYNVFDGAHWLDQDIQISEGGHTLTSAGPSLAVFNGKLYMAYKGKEDDDTRIFYNVFDGAHWLDQDIRISEGGHTLTSAGPSLAVFNGKLYMAYRDGGDSRIWYNVFDGAHWREEDCLITSKGAVKTARGPCIAAYLTSLYLVYRDDS